MNARSRTYLLAIIGTLLLVFTGTLIVAAGSEGAAAPTAVSAGDSRAAVQESTVQDTEGPLTLALAVSDEFAMLGDSVAYTLTLANTGNVVASDLRVEDPVPPETEFVPDSASANFGTVGFSNNTIIWTGDVPPNNAAVIRFRVAIRPYEGCTTVITNRAGLFNAGNVLLSNTVHTQLLCPDLGDAPDSTNHYTNTMTAYAATGVLARFPTVFDPASGMLQGPAHWLPRADVWLGRWVSGERDADLLPDEDGTPNLKPPSDIADRDRFDDGVQLPVSLRHCQVNTLDYRVTARAGLARQRYVNIWFDYNRDGDWDDVFDCGNGLVAREHAVVDQLVNVPGAAGLTSNVYTSLPYVAYTPVANRPLWARISLAERPAPAGSVGNGPASGYRWGETEDYLLPGRQGDPVALRIFKTVDRAQAWLGETLTYSITLRNTSNEPANGLQMRDPIPDGTQFVSGSLTSTLPAATFDGGAVRWDGDLPPLSQVHVHFQVNVGESTTHPALCGGRIVNLASVAAPGISLESDPVYTYLVCPDEGDAPDSSNHAGVPMLAYPATPARFPTVFDPATGPVQGPRHWLPKADAYLGRGVSGERDADLLPDQDGLTNIDPPANAANRDGMDDGLLRPLNLPNCQPTTIRYVVTIVGPARDRFLNVWFDWNRDGDWEDRLQCPNMAAPADEWAVKNQVIAFGPGTYVVTSPAFLPVNPSVDRPMWLRVTLSERPAPLNPATGLADGRGPAAGYRSGETEDYILGRGEGTPDVWVHKEGRRVDPDGGPSTQAAPPTGWRLYYHITYGNRGTATADDVTVTDTLPAGLEYRFSYSNPDHEPPVVSNGDVSWAIGSLGAGERGFIDLWVRGPVHTFPPGTVLTNVVVITTSTPGDDPGNNRDVVSTTLPLLPPRIVDPVPGTTCDGTLVVRGVSAIGSSVDVYVDNMPAGSATVDANGRWSLTLSGLSDGPHGIYAVATYGAASSPPSPTIVVIVDSSLLWDPISMTFTAYDASGQPLVQHIRTPDGRADPDGWRVRLRPPLTYTVDVRVCCDQPASAAVTLTVGITDYVLSHVGAGHYQTTIAAPGVPGIPLTLTVSCDGQTGSGSGTGLIDPDGYVFDVDLGVDKSEPIANLADRSVTALEDQDDAWNRWPAELYEAQINPQVTAADGYYSFFTPPGDYQITVDADAAYQAYRSWTLTVVDTPVHLDIPLTRVYDSSQAAVSVDENGFQPAVLQVWQGAVVEWRNAEADAQAFHSATSDLDARLDTAGWDSGLLERDETYRRRFDSLGTFSYHDVQNPPAVGSIQVCYRTDVDCSGAVDVLDLVAAGQQWGSGFDSRYDIDGDGMMTVADIMAIAADFGWTMP